MDDTIGTIVPINNINEDPDTNNRRSNNNNDGGSSAAIDNINDNETFFDYSNLENDDNSSDSKSDNSDDDHSSYRSALNTNNNIIINTNNRSNSSVNEESRIDTLTRPFHQDDLSRQEQIDMTAENRTVSNEEASTALDRYIQAMDWSGVLRRVKSHPNECRTIDTTTGQTPLHVACDNGAPAVVIQSLCQAYPLASVRTDRCNMNPLHILCSSSSNYSDFHHVSLHCIRALLNHGRSEQISMRDVDGDTPLHAACRCGADKDIIELLIQAYPAAISLHDAEGFTPLLRLWVRYYVLLGESQIQCAIVHPTKVYNTDERFRSAWDITELILRYAHYGTATEEDTAAAAVSMSRNQSSSNSQAIIPTSIYTTCNSLQQQLSKSCHQNIYSSQQHQLSYRHQNQLSSLSSVLHAASAIDCPRFVVRIAAEKYKEYLFIRDKYGRTPLMIACSAPIYPCHNLSDEIDHEASETDQDDTYEQAIEGDDINDEERTRHHTLTISSTINGRVKLSPHVCECEDSVIHILLEASIRTEMTSPTATQSVAIANKLLPIHKQYEHTRSDKCGGANMYDPSGRLPIHIAIISGKTWCDGIDKLVYCYPESLGIADKSSKLLPYQLAAVVKRNSTLHQQQPSNTCRIEDCNDYNHGAKSTKNDNNGNNINLCYNLLRFNPVILSMGTIMNIPATNTTDVVHNNNNNNNNLSAASTSNIGNSMHIDKKQKL